MTLNFGIKRKHEKNPMNNNKAEKELLFPLNNRDYTIS